MPLYQFTWQQLRRARIRHWLATTDPIYSHWDSLSLEQAPSHDGGTTQGQITWYDYAGKPLGVNYERGTEVLPSVIARVMPDGSSWYQYFQRNTNGLPTKFVEKWVEGGSAHFRTNALVYAANNLDMVAWTNTLGVRASSNVFDAYHQVATNYDGLNQATTYTYDAGTHQLTKVVRPSGLTNSYTYNASHRLQQETDQPINATRSYTWYSNGNLQTLTDERALVTTYFWDYLNRLTGTSRADGATTNLYYRLSGVPYPNGNGGINLLDMTATKDRLGHWTYYDYDSLRRRSAETNAIGTVTRYGYCYCGAMGYITNAFGAPIQQATTMLYDYQGNRSFVYNADGYNLTNWYDSLGQLAATGDGWGYRWFYYNNLGLLTTISNAFGPERIVAYDLKDRPQYVTDANAVTVTNTYDNLDRLLTRGYPGGGVEKFGYSARGMIAYTNQIGLTNFYAYDAAGRTTFATNANAELIRYTNNAAGDLLSLTDGKNQTTKWSYDQYGRVTNKVDQAGTVILKYDYDPGDRLTNRWSVAKGTTYYTYDAADHLTFVNYPSSPDVTFQYDALGRLTNMVDAAGTTKYTYTSGNQLLTEDGPWSSDTVTNSYTYRQRTGWVVQQPTGTWTNRFGYDTAKRLTNVTSQAGSFNYTYLYPRLSLPAKIALPNSSYITNAYDGVARLTGAYLKNSGNSVLDSATYGYNAANQRTTFTNAAGTFVQLAYDRIGQLTVADSSVNTEDRGYYYDSAWNLNRLTNNGVSASTPSMCSTRSPAGRTATYGYDNNGNLTGKRHRRRGHELHLR